MSTNTTKQELLQAAQRLFATKGLNDTTMSDIAKESGKGRRTLYLYFDCKADIYKAVINAELEKIMAALDAVVAKNIPADRKLFEFTSERFRVLQEVVVENGTLRSKFFRDIWTVEHYRKNFNRREKQLLVDIFVDGMTQGVFQIDDARLTAEIFQYCMRGFEVPYIQGHINGINQRLDISNEYVKFMKRALGMRNSK